MQKITTCLWFDNNAQEAVNYYLSIFEDSKITEVTHYGEIGPKPKGTVMTIAFKLNGQEFLALNGGPYFKFNEAVSLIVSCKTQEEIDDMWKKLTKGGHEVQCGWLKDKYGLSWQVVPVILRKMMLGEDKKKTDRVIQAMLGMKKLNIKDLEKAYTQE